MLTHGSGLHGGTPGLPSSSAVSFHFSAPCDTGCWLLFQPNERRLFASFFFWFPRHPNSVKSTGSLLIISAVQLPEVFQGFRHLLPFVSTTDGFPLNNVQYAIKMGVNELLYAERWLDCDHTAQPAQWPDLPERHAHAVTLCRISHAANPTQ